MNLKNALTGLCAILEACNMALNFIPWHGAFLITATFIRALIDQFWPAQSNVPTPAAK